MVKAIVKIDEETNKLLNTLKAQHGLKDKSQAINQMAKEYRELILESGIRPDYVMRWRKIQKKRILKVGTVQDFRKRYGLK
ncbi:MAG: antitoxin [Candidatus Hadarchaeota archaeon]